MPSYECSDYGKDLRRIEYGRDVHLRGLYFYKSIEEWGHLVVERIFVTKAPFLTLNCKTVDETIYPISMRYCNRAENNRIGNFLFVNSINTLLATEDFDKQKLPLMSIDTWLVTYCIMLGLFDLQNLQGIVNLTNRQPLAFYSNIAAKTLVDNVASFGCDISTITEYMSMTKSGYLNEYQSVLPCQLQPQLQVNNHVGTLKAFVDMWNLEFDNLDIVTNLILHSSTSGTIKVSTISAFLDRQYGSAIYARNYRDYRNPPFKYSELSKILPISTAFKTDVRSLLANIVDYLNFSDYNNIAIEIHSPDNYTISGNTILNKLIDHRTAKLQLDIVHLIYNLCQQEADNKPIQLIKVIKTWLEELFIQVIYSDNTTDCYYLNLASYSLSSFALLNRSLLHER